MFNDDVEDATPIEDAPAVDPGTVATAADQLTTGVQAPEHHGEYDESGDPIWYTTGEHPRHPEVAGQPDPRG